MELVFQNKTSAFLQQILHETRSQEQTAELIVPDSFPDAARIVSSCAEAILRGKECRQGSVTVTGAIRAGVLYMPEDESAPRALDAYVPFSLRIDHPAATEQMQSLLDLRVRSVDARMIHSRKVLLRVNLGCELTGFEQTSETFYTLSQPPAELQVKKQTYPLLLPVETAERSFTVSEELELPAGKPEIQNICWYTAQPLVTERKLIGNKAVFKGMLLVKALYQAADGSLNVFPQELPYSQYCELEQDYEQDALMLLPAVTGAELELSPDAQGRKLQLTVNLLMQALVQALRPVELCEDAYATRGTFEPEWKQYALPCMLDHQQLHETLRESFTAPVRAVIDSTLYLDYPEQSRTPAGVQIKAPCTVNIVYLDNDGAVQGLTGRAQADSEIALSENGVCAAHVAAGRDGFASPGSSGADIRYDILFELESSANQTLKSLCGGKLEQAERREGRRPAVVIRQAERTQSVWELAKCYGTTVQAISQANQLSGEQVERGEMLLIPIQP